MKKEWVLTQDAFDGLLDWLDADRDHAGSKYETIRLRLIKIFTCRGCADAEDLADETINRVTAKVAEVAGSYIGDPIHYFWGVAHKVHLEYLRKSHGRQASLVAAGVGRQDPPLPGFAEDVQPEYECLERCLERLPAHSHDLVVGYYQHERLAKIEHRKRLAKELGIAVNALRIRAHRIRLALQQCVQHCLQQQLAS